MIGGCVQITSNKRTHGFGFFGGDLVAPRWRMTVRNGGFMGTE
jgi:hypothetical protein